MCIDDESVLNILKFGVLLIVLATLLSLIITAFRLLFNLKFKKAPIYSVLSVISFVGFALLIYGGIKYFKSVDTKATFTQNISIEKHDTLYLTTLKKEFNNEKISILKDDEDEHFSVSDEGILQQTQKLKIKKSLSDSAFIEIKKTSHGTNKSDAFKHSVHFQYNILSHDSSIIFDQGIFIPKNEKWKYPDVKMILNIPVGIIVKIDEGVLEMLNRNNEDYYGKTFMMTEKGLKCLNSKDENSSDENDADDDKDVKINWSMSDDDSTGYDIHIITKNKKVIIKNGKKIEVEEKRFGPFHIKIERHKNDNN